MRCRENTLVICCTVAIALAGMGNAIAQKEFPTRPVRLVNPFTPGGNVDIVARSVAQGLTENWGQQVIVDNRAGAGTTIGTEIVVRADPDGYTMLCTSSAISIMPNMYPKLRFDPVRDLLPIVQVVSSSPMLAVHPGFPAKTVRELISLARAQPGVITAASSGVGSSNHLSLEMFKSIANVDVLHVPYKGGSPAIADLISGQVKIFFNSAAIFLPLAKAGRVRVLATGGAQRADYAPDVPTLSESGVPGYEAATWFGVYGPRALPPQLAQRWNESINRYLKTTQAQEYYRKNYMLPVGGTIAAFTEYHRSETTRWGKLITAAGIKPL